MRINKYTFFLIGYLLQNIIFWVGIQSSGITDLTINLLYSFSNGFLATAAGIMGLLISRHWGGSKSAVGKAVMFISLGITSWGIGTLTWSFYNFVLNIEVPYPSWADLGYTLAIPFWAIGVFYLSKATGARFTLRKLRGRLMLILLPLLAAVASYYFLYVIARESSFVIEGELLKIFLDFYYPLGDWIILTVAFLLFGLSLQYLGGRFRWPVMIIILGFIFMFISDFTFSYTTTVGSYFNGHFADLLFTVAIFVISFGVTGFDTQET
ncbi:MAG: hypothetical protein AAB609_00900 [Patescibacteria group bacterium]